MEENNNELNQEPIQNNEQEAIQGPVEMANQENLQEEPIPSTQKVEKTENTEQKFTTMGQVNEPKTKKKKSKIGVLVFIILLLAAVAGGLVYYYFNVYTNPKVVYQQIIKTGLNSLTETTEEITTLKLQTKLDVDIQLEEQYMEDGVEDLLDIINNIDAAVEMQFDTNEKKALVKLDSNYEGDELLNADMLLDAKNKGTFLKAQQFFEDVIEVELEDEYYEELETSLDFNQPSEEEKNNSKKALKILSDELVKIIKDEYCSKEKEIITINGKEINADTYVLKMTYPQMSKELINICNNLKSNEQFLNSFEDKEESKEALEALIEELEYAAEDYEDALLTIKLYRSGLKQEFVRVDGEAEIEGETIVVKVEKAQDSYKLELIALEETMLSATIRTTQLDEDTAKLNLAFDIEEIGKFVIDLECGYTINENIDTIETKDAKMLDEFTQKEQEKVLKNLQESKLYQLIGDFSALSGNSDLGGEDIIELPNEDNALTETPDDTNEEETPNDDENVILNDLEKNIKTSGVLSKAGKLVVVAKNNNSVAIDLNIEVEFYDENGTFVGSSEDYLTAVGAGNEIAIEMYNTPVKFATYKIYVEAEETEEIEYFNQIQITHSKTDENVAVQVKNNSQDTIEYITVSVVFYKDGKVVGYEDGMDSDIKSGRTGNFNIDFPYDAEYNDVEFDDYKVYVTEAYSYNW